MLESLLLKSSVFKFVLTFCIINWKNNKFCIVHTCMHWDHCHPPYCMLQTSVVSPPGLQQALHGLAGCGGNDFTCG